MDIAVFAPNLFLLKLARIAIHLPFYTCTILFNTKQIKISQKEVRESAFYQVGTPIFI